MRKQLAVCSTLVLGAALGATALGAPQDSSRPHYVSAKPDDSAVPKLDPKDVAGAKGGDNPYRLSHSLGLSPKSRVQIDGFMSAGVAHINSKRDYLIPEHGAVGDNYNFNALSLLGLQFTAKLVQNLSVVAQVVANGDNTNGNRAYSVNLDYGYARYEIKGFEFRAGRFRLPAFMYSATQEIGYTFPWLTLPNEVYRIVPFENTNGFDTVYRYGIGTGGWNVSFEPYVGSSSSKSDLYTNVDTSDINEVPTANFDENSMVGAVATLGNKYVTFRADYTHLKLSGSYTGFDTSGNLVHQQIVHNQSDEFYSFGGKLLLDGIMFVTEYAHRDTPDPLASLSGYYAMIGYKASGFLPNLTYGRLWTTNTNALAEDASRPTERPMKQESYTLGLDYYMNANIVFKGSIADIRPLGGTRGLFDTVEPNTLKRNNWLYMLGIDAIF